MRTEVLSTLAGIVLAATSGLGQAKPVPKLTAAQQFAHAKVLIENNCIDCEGGTIAGTEQGITEMKQAIASGYPDKVAAYKLLDNAYADMDTYTEKDPKEHAVYATERTESMSVLYKLAPNDPEVLERYADYVQDNTEKARLLKRVVELDPKRTGALYGLGLITAQKDVAEGMRIVEQAIIQEKDNESVMTYTEGLMEIMQTHSCGLPNAQSWLDNVRAAYDQATNGAGDPKAMPEFKTQFLNAVKQQHCGNALTK